MNDFKKKLVSGALVVALSSIGVVSFAERNEQKAYGLEQRFDYIFNQLALSETQQADVIGIIEDARLNQREEMKAQMALVQESSPDLTRKERRELVKDMSLQNLADQLNTVLSPDITAELVEYMEAHTGHRLSKKQHKNEGKNKDTSNFATDGAEG